MTNLGLYTVPICANFANPAEVLQSSSSIIKKKMFLTCVNVTNQIKQDNMLIQIPILSFKTHYDDPKSNYNRDNYTCTTRLIPNWLNWWCYTSPSVTTSPMSPEKHAQQLNRETACYYDYRSLINTGQTTLLSKSVTKIPTDRKLSISVINCASRLVCSLYR